MNLESWKSHKTPKHAPKTLDPQTGEKARTPKNAAVRPSGLRPSARPCCSSTMRLRRNCCAAIWRRALAGLEVGGRGWPIPEVAGLWTRVCEGLKQCRIEGLASGLTGKVDPRLFTHPCFDYSFLSLHIAEPYSVLLPFPSTPQCLDTPSRPMSPAISKGTCKPKPQPTGLQKDCSQKHRD